MDTATTKNQLEKQQPRPPGIYSPEEEKCLIFSKGSRILYASDQELTQLIAYLLNLTGVNADRFPEPVQMIVLLDFIKLTYPGNTLQEVKLAFQMALAGKLELPKDYGHYQNFSSAYFGQTMAAYRQWAAQVHEYHDKKEKPKEIAHAVIEMTDEELLTATFETYKVIKNPFVIPESVFFYLEKTGKLVMTNRQKWKIMERINCPDPEKKKATCRKVAVSEYFNELILNGRPLH